VTYLRPGEAARLLGVTPATVAALADQGLLPVVHLPSGHRRYAEGAVRRLVAERGWEPRRQAGNGSISPRQQSARQPSAATAHELEPTLPNGGEDIPF
jgi:predicted site-specific integrase-resolvase